MYRILLVEDSVDYQKLVSNVLKSVGQLVIADTIANAIKEIAKGTFDLFLLDVMLPDGEGFKLATMLQEEPKTKNIPVIFLTARGDITDKVMGFKLGADDYIVKPFDLVEFRVRVETRLQKHQNLKQSQDVLVRGNLKLEIPTQKAQLIAEQKNLDLTPLQFKILFFLVSQENEVVTREKLINIIWGKDVHIGRSIDTHINALRKKLGDYGKLIQSIYGKGYLFSQTPPPLTKK